MFTVNLNIPKLNLSVFQIFDKWTLLFLLTARGCKIADTRGGEFSFSPEYFVGNFAKKLSSLEPITLRMTIGWQTSQSKHVSVIFCRWPLISALLFWHWETLRILKLFSVPSWVSSVVLLLVKTAVYELQNINGFVRRPNISRQMFTCWSCKASHSWMLAYIWRSWECRGEGWGCWRDSREFLGIT